ncbi:hypothetical protein LTR56_016543 [Elasticomyces elasticus]|nr:hypothetical protein LTR22_025321 [Elasticomyces elasticus]KAK3632058.1 hypothetical protein LTR56_016543 [Elasticomyces elasticus]KAK4931836.1 hypothetical protein LTR49_001903 [Elasticomyces elasticus]KAK5754692.1 hypothetical protein LTS12_015195 [Elasticomyces elasticus]
MAPLQPTAAVAKLDELYHHLETITATSSDADFNKFIFVFTQDCDCNIRSMREFPTTNKQALLADVKDLFQNYRLVSRKVDAQAVSQNGNMTVVFGQMSNRLEYGRRPPTRFRRLQWLRSTAKRDQLASSNCIAVAVPSEAMQEKTRLGPYSEEYMASCPARRRTIVRCKRQARLPRRDGSVIDMLSQRSQGD